MVWNLVHCPSLSKQESFWDVEPSIVSCCGRRALEATEGFARIAMETVMSSSLEKHETNPIPSLPSFFILSYFKTRCSSAHPQGSSIPSTVTHENKHTHTPKYAQKL